VLHFPTSYGHGDFLVRCLGEGITIVLFSGDQCLDLGLRGQARSRRCIDRGGKSSIVIEQNCWLRSVLGRPSWSIYACRIGDPIEVLPDKISVLFDVPGKVALQSLFSPKSVHLPIVIHAMRLTPGC
jgi:hypothetical protein